MAHLSEESLENPPRKQYFLGLDFSTQQVDSFCIQIFPSVEMILFFFSKD